MHEDHWLDTYWVDHFKKPWYQPNCATALSATWESHVRQSVKEET